MEPSSDDSTGQKRPFNSDDKVPRPVQMMSSPNVYENQESNSRQPNLFSHASLVSSELINSGTYDHRLSMADGAVGRLINNDIEETNAEEMGDEIKRTKTELEPVHELTLFTGNTLESPAMASSTTHKNPIDLNDYHMRIHQSKQRRKSHGGPSPSISAKN